MFRVVKVIDKDTREWLTPEGQWDSEFTKAKVFTDFDEAHAKATDLGANVWSSKPKKAKP